MDSDFQKQHTYYNVKETLPIDISQDNITPLISSISKDKKRKKLFLLPTLPQITCSTGATRNVSDIPNQGRGSATSCHEQMEPTGMLDLWGAANMSLDKIKVFGAVCHLVLPW